MYRTDVIDEAHWDAFLERRPEANFLQSWQWGDTYEILGETVIREGFFKDDKLIGCMLAVVKDARRGRYLEVPGGPIIDWNNQTLARFSYQRMQALARQYSCVFVRIRPQLYEQNDTTNLFAELGFIKAPMHLHAEHTNILSLEPSEEELLANMRRQTRYEVRRSDKQQVEISRANDHAAVEEFFAVQADTARRQNFIPPSKRLLEAQMRAFGGHAWIYKAEKDGQLLNLALVILYGQEAVYLEAASTSEARKYPGAYGLLWQAIRDARAAGCTRFNFWGIAYSNDPKHRYAGVTTFKRGFGGEDVTYVSAHDLVVYRLRYVKNWIVESIRKKKRKL